MAREPITPRAALATAGARSATDAIVLGNGPSGAKVRGQIFAALLYLMVSLALIGLALLLIQAFVKGQDRLGIDLFTEATGVVPADSGFKYAILGTLWVIGGVILISVPIGVGAAIYLEEYGDDSKWWNRVIELNIQNLAAVPSVVYGILGLAFIVRGPLSLGPVVIAGSLTLTLLVLPVIIIAAREAIRAVPPSIREGSLAVGATQWQTIRHQVMPASIPGIVTGCILAVSRAIGEAAPLIVIGVGALVTASPQDPFSDRFTALPVQIFQYFTRAQDDYKILAAAGIIVMLLVVVAMNSFAVWLRNRYEQRW